MVYIESAREDGFRIHGAVNGDSMKTFLLSRGVALAALLFTLGFASNASAQFLGLDDTGTEGILTTSSTSTTVGALTTGGVVATIVALTPKPGKNKPLRAYLEANPAEVRQSIALGGGSSAVDLANFFAVSPENRGEFAILLRNQRATLLPLMADGRVEEGELLVFVSSIHQAMLMHDVLATDALALAQ